MADIVPFGKYKNQPLAALAEDKSYCEWLSGQSWVAQRFPEIHTLIINNFAEPSDTPEHNALQLQFLDDALQLKVSMCMALWKRPFYEYFALERYLPMLTYCTEPKFEERGIDVQWEVGVAFPDPGYGYRRWSQYGFKLAIECKPSLGDDYPAVLRFMHGLPKLEYNQDYWKVVVVESYNFRGGTIDQVRKLFLSSGVLLTDMPSLAELLSVSCIPLQDLPPVQDFVR